MGHWATRTEVMMSEVVQNDTISLGTRFCYELTCDVLMSLPVAIEDSDLLNTSETEV